MDVSTLSVLGASTSNLKGKTPVRSFVCRIVSEGETESVTVGTRPLLFGSDSSCDVVVQDPTVSRQHAELKAVPDGVQVRDLGSTNGIRWGTSRITDAVIPSGTTLRLGEVELRLGAQDQPAVKPSSRSAFGSLKGDSHVMREVFAILELASRSDVTVLLQGESGTGKELAARAVHDHSKRAGSPFVVVDCASLPHQTIDSHLFGHVKGAFTGASGDRKGAFLEGDSGTVFLDEIGELPPESQARLLRVLETQTIQPLGSDKRFPVNNRLVAATHRDLQEMVADNQFRLDLYYRLAVIHVWIPPLRQRLEDIPSLVHAFYESRGCSPGPLSQENLSRLKSHAWPGNARELRNVLERAMVLTGTDRAPFSELRIGLDASRESTSGDFVKTDLPFKEAKNHCVDLFEDRYLAALLANHESVTRAAEASGLSRQHLSELIRKHGLGKSNKPE